MELGTDIIEDALQIDGRNVIIITLRRDPEATIRD